MVESVEERQALIKEKMQQYYDAKLEHPRSLFTYDKNNVIKEGDTVVFFERRDQFKQVTIKRGQQYTVTKGGVIKHDDIIDNNERFGTKVFSSNKRAFCLILKPNTDMYTKSLS